jgi:DNA repair protein RadC
VIYLDAIHRDVEAEEPFAGTLTQTSVYPREIVKRALHFNAAAACLSHVHPSGSTEPSRADEHLTCAVRQSLALVDVRVLDHIIVAADGSSSPLVWSTFLRPRPGNVTVARPNGEG